MKKLLQKKYLIFIIPAILLLILLIAAAPGAIYREHHYRSAMNALHEGDLAAAQDAEDFGGQVQVSALIIPHFMGAGKAVHGEGRKNKNLIRFQQEQLIVHAHKLPAAEMNVELKIIMAVKLGHLKGFTDLIVGFVSLLSLLSHGQERRLARF